MFFVVQVVLALTLKATLSIMWEMSKLQLFEISIQEIISIL